MHIDRENKQEEKKKENQVFSANTATSLPKAMKARNIR